MKILYAILFIIGFFLSSCDANRGKMTERTVIERDTLQSETEYEIEKTIQEKTVTVDTITERETVTTEDEYMTDEQVEENDENPEF